MSGNSVHTVSSGETLWSFARSSCTPDSSGQVTDTAIVNEMKRLARVNGYGDDYEALSKDYFRTAGKTIVVYESDSSNSSNSAKIVDKDVFIQEINGLRSTKDRIIEYNKSFGKGYYAIVDKKACTLVIYDKDGNVMKDEQGRDVIVPVGVGKYKGDKLMYGYAADKSDPIHEQGRYTAAGEFTLDELDNRVRSENSMKMYGSRVMDLKGDNRGEQSAQMALHQVPVDFQGESNARIQALQSDKLGDGRINPKRNVSDNRMSYGCVNLLPEDYDLVYQYIGEGSKVYVLPEERGNQLVLEKQANGKYKFVQLFHKDQKRDLSAEDASKVCYDKNLLRSDSFGGFVKGALYKGYNAISSIF